ncbi:MAG TPA: hypothetical protein VHB74_08350 [Devosia sp.]|nr:hypothetical protein [Devosia sp.]
MRLFQTIRVAATALGLGLLLAACTITSAQPLVADAEAVTPLPDHFIFYSYKAGPDGYRRTEDGPMIFTRRGKTYVATDPSTKDDHMVLRFLPLSHGYLLAVNGMDGDPDGTLYGFMSYANGVMSLETTPDAGTAAAIEKARPGTKALDELAIGSSGEIELSSRAALDALIDLYEQGRLPLGDRLVGEVVENPDAQPATRLIATATGWTKVL